MSYIDDAFSKINSILDVFGQPAYQPYEYRPASYTVTIATKPRKRVHYHPSRSGRRWK
jgi:hypothetical protein